jgi:hypothetical protein
MHIVMICLGTPPILAGRVWPTHGPEPTVLQKITNHFSYAPCIHSFRNRIELS